MSNPFFNEKKMNEDAAGWAAPAANTAVAGKPQGFPTGEPVTDGPVSTWKSAMTVNGVITAAAVLFVLLISSATFGWMSTSVDETTDVVSFPAFSMIGVIIGFIAVLVAYRKPQWAKLLGPVYALGYGFFVGAISRYYESFNQGIVLQAVGATMAVFFVMLVMYRTGIVKVTPGFRKIVVGATAGIMILYLVSIVLNLFTDGGIAFINSPSLFGIGFSVFVCAIAASNLALDFDLIDRGVEQKMSKDYEWVAALGLVVTIVWLYLEILRLLSKLNRS